MVAAQPATDAAADALADAPLSANPDLPEWLRRIYPFAPNRLDVGGPRLHYVDEGSGEPVVMLHGNPTWSFFFRRLITDVSQTHRAIAPDHIGCGLSDKPREYDYTLRTHVANFAALMDHLELTDVTLVMHDWGGAIGCAWAVENPDRVKRIVVMNTACFLVGGLPWRIRICKTPVLGRLAVRNLNLFCKSALLFASAKRNRLRGDVSRGLLYPYDSAANRIAVHRFVQDIPLPPRRDSRRIIAEAERKLDVLGGKPMQVYWGMRDFCFTPVFLREWRRRFPQAEVKTFDDAGHYVMEDAHEHIVPGVRDFLNRT